jgi:hypothetical protein
LNRIELFEKFFSKRKEGSRKKEGYRKERQGKFTNLFFWVIFNKFSKFQPLNDQKIKEILKKNSSPERRTFLF